jgi:tetratricopeptide (TPR) repeat protein
MTLATRVRLLMVVAVVLWLLAAFWGHRRLGLNPVAWALILMAITFVSAHFLLRPTARRCREAIRREDIPAARRELTELAPLAGLLPGVRRMVQSWEITVLLLEDRFVEALPKVQVLCEKRALPPVKQLRLNNLAWCLAHAGDGGKALEISQVVLRDTERLGITELLPYALGTLGTAYFLSGQPVQAVEYLERSLAIGAGDARAQATRAYYLGESLRALGKAEAARDAYQRACQELPEGKFADRARKRLDSN